MDARQQRQGCAAVAHTFFVLHQHCNDGAPASRSAALSEVIKFVGGLLCVCRRYRKSSRVRGMTEATAHSQHGHGVGEGRRRR